MTTTNEFAGRTALVTGAASGIGAACARWLDRHGIGTLVLLDTDKDGLDALDLSCQIIPVIGSVADRNLWQRLAQQVPELHYAVANAGVGGSGTIAEHSWESWRQVMDVNCDGVFLTLQYAMPAMKRAGGGNAVVTSSVTGIKPVAGIGAYGVAKAGVAHLARIAALEGAPDKIRVNAIAPGGVDTAIWEGSPEFLASVAEHGREATLKGMAAGTPRGQFATTEEIAAQIGFLLSETSANITGAVLTSDGGWAL